MKWTLLALSLFIFTSCTHRDHDGVTRNTKTAKDKYFDGYYESAPK